MTSSTVRSNPYASPESVSVPKSFLGLGRFGRNIVSNAGGNALNAVMQLGLLFVLIRKLDVAAYAAFLLATFIVGLLEMASDFGTRIWATREFSFTQSSRWTIRRSVECKVVYTILAAATATLMPSNTLDWTAFALCVCVAATQPSTDPLLWLLRGKERLDVEAGVVLLFRTTVIVGMLVAAFAGFGLHLLLTIWLGGNVCRIVIESQLKVVQSVLAGDTTFNETSRDEPLPATLRYVLPIGSAFVLTALFQRATVFLLDIYSSPEDVKYYGTAFKLVSTAGFIATSVFVSSFATLTQAIDAGDEEKIRDVVRRMMLLVSGIFVPACAVGIVMAQPMAAYLGDPEFTRIAGVVALLMPGMYLSCINMGFKYTLNAFELNWQDFAAVVLGLGILTAVTIFHGSLSWCQAAALGWALGEASLLLCRIGILRKHQKHHGVPAKVILGSSTGLVALAVLSQAAVS